MHILQAKNQSFSDHAAPRSQLVFCATVKRRSGVPVAVTLTVIPVTAQKRQDGFDLYGEITRSLQSGGINLQDGDVLIVSSKYVSNAQRRIIALDGVAASHGAAALAKMHAMNPRIAEIIIRESDRVFGGIAGFVMASSDSIMAPNAGIDKSNAKSGTVILYPDDPYRTAEQIRRKILLSESVHVGVIITDSRLMPARVGTTGVAIACAGLEPVADMRAKTDLNGRPLKVTFQATADSLATIANLKMGESSESTPIVIARDSGAVMTDRRIGCDEMAISHEQCVYVRSLRRDCAA